jgi:ElaB/YqjD/DUF883 family membrane-anchored ribosome-binding protein
MTTSSEPYASSTSGSERQATPQAPPRRAPSRSRSTGSEEGAITRVSNFAASVAARIRQQPYVSLAIAGGVGFVVGGALSFRAGRVVLVAAARQIGRQLINDVL